MSRPRPVPQPAESTPDVAGRLMDVDTEKIVLGQILGYPAKAWPDYREAGLRLNDFARSPHRMIFEAVNHADADGLEPDVPIVLAQLRDAGRYDEVGPAFVTLLPEGVPRPAQQNIVAMVGRLRMFARARAAYYGTQKIGAELVQNPEAVNNGLLARHQKLIDEIVSDAGPQAYRSRFVSAADVMRVARPSAIVEGVAWADCLTVLAAESGTGKTFVLLDVAASVSGGGRWHGRATDPAQGSVAYISFEGDALGLRLSAIDAGKGGHLDNVHVLRASDPLSPHVTRDGTETPSSGELAITADLDALAKQLAASGRPRITMVVIDTVRASLSGSEDSSEHVAAYIRAVRRLLACVPGAAGILAHHTGWQDGDSRRKRERGSSAFRGNCDATLYLEVDSDGSDRNREARITLRALKVRDEDLPAPLHLIRKQVVLAETDSWGRPLTSCVIEADNRSRKRSRRGGGRQGECRTAGRRPEGAPGRAHPPDRRNERQRGASPRRHGHGSRQRGAQSTRRCRSHRAGQARPALPTHARWPDGADGGHAMTTITLRDDLRVPLPALEWLWAIEARGIDVTLDPTGTCLLVDTSQLTARERALLRNLHNEIVTVVWWCEQEIAE